MAMMIAIQKALKDQDMPTRERQFMRWSLSCLCSMSGQQPEKIQHWTITSFEVEFGLEIGSGGLYVYCTQAICDDSIVIFSVERCTKGCGITPQ